MNRPIEAKAADLNYIRDVLRRLVPDRDVHAFGSRVTGRSRKFSDLDLAIMGETPLPTATLADLDDAFDESDLPFKVDILDWATTSETFRAIVRKDAVPIQSASAANRPDGQTNVNAGE
jgi:type I restriction enzyme S subunit